ncbi:MAG: alkaline phosphatase family protein, partial [Actinomycetota bacterium]|nr:alkaline phosphatase family protein [Actinomycetota bacterium]
HDYRAMTAGLTDRVDPPSDNVFQSIDQTQLTWQSFQESMGGNCGVQTSQTVPGTNKALYSRGHDAAYLYRANETCDTNDVPLISDTQLGNLPDFSVIIPNLCDDMHTYPPTGACPAYFGDVSGSNTRLIGDAWLQHVVPTILTDPSVTVIVTFDEGTAKSAQHIYAVEVGAGVDAGATDSTLYDHYGLLAGIYEAFGLGTAPNNASTATPFPIPPR